MNPLPASFRETREALRALCCYAVSPARKARTGRIGLRPHGGGIATPPFDDGTRIVVHGDRLGVEPGDDVAITTVRDAAAFLGVELRADPGVGHDLPPFEPDERLAVDPTASHALGHWYAFGEQLLDAVRADAGDAEVSEAQLWPEHFDLAISMATPGGETNVGCSPGDEFSVEPYVYVGPHDMTGLADPVWNAPFGAVLRRTELGDGSDPLGAALAFVRHCLDALARRAEP